MNKNQSPRLKEIRVWAINANLHFFPQKSSFENVTVRRIAPNFTFHTLETLIEMEILLKFSIYIKFYFEMFNNLKLR